ncbi:helicase carboxy-terminal domain protein (macronuclear) [Tetrahymena thermophila SB210]|uniref:Helicase carboxy-terminal domain protein n=1 Tax=Tetrahymena thermophila (strain SB210) TaxID=312017 RepID=Q22U20_TETTS|nr:helicase carboxy-terminal domain protein [Tetrahymena thermophila SB210]EAR88867.2 helicase carboxy-terminal domain protein [Tetrahymena thermophila SB210]|eukprot:XP_001009112.2 helicase carboxy-terminal domain protein [Tetrahymena thermophila SB210]
MISEDSNYEETKINNEGNEDKNHQDILGIKQKSSQQSRSYFQKPQMQIQKENLQEVIPSLISTQVATQKIREQLESKLELDLECESLIQSQIQGTQDDIEIFQKKNQQNNLLQIKDTLVEQAEKFAQELKNKLKTEILKNQKLQQQLESQLNELLNELELTDAKLITEEIEDFSYLIQRQISRNQINMAYGSKIRLNKLNEAQVKYKALLELEGQILLDQNQVKQQQFDVELNVLPQELNLEDESYIQSQVKLNQNQSQQQLLKKQLNDLLQELDLEDESQIQSQIKLYQNQVQLQQFEEKLNVLPQKLDLEDESQIQSQVKLYQNQVKQQQSEEKLKVLQQKLDLEDESLIQSKVKLYQIENFQNQNLLKNANISKIRLQKLKEAQRIQILLNNKSNENQIEQPQPKNSNNSHIKLKENEFQNSDLPQNQPFDVIKQYKLSDLRKDISLIPESSEKYLLEMIEICLNIYKQVDTPQTDPGNSQLLTQKEKIEKRLIIEDQITPEISLHLQNIQQNIDQDNFKGIIDETDMLIKKVRPLNINEMKRLIHEVDKAAQVVEGQDIIIFLGVTGVGKSTTIHFLAGSEMAEQKIQIQEGVFNNQIVPVKIKNKTLQKIKVGFSAATSETRFITPVNIKFKDLNMASSDSIILCDSPGFDDISGPEVDIANGLGIVKVIKKCRSVRPIILLSFEGQGDIGQGIKQLAHILIGFVDNIQDKLSSLSYLFSKYPKDYNINSELINIKNIIDQITEEKSDEAFVILIDDMIEKTKKSRNIIDPLKGNPTEILNNLMKQEGIQDPSQVFKFSITNNSYSAITNYIFKTKQIIISALSRSEYELINFKLDELKFLIDILNLESTKKVYEDCVNYIQEAVKKDYENVTEQLNQQIQNNKKLDTNYLKEYQEFFQKFSKIQSLRNNHLSANFSTANELIDELKLVVKKLAQVFDQENIIQTPVLVNLDNIKLISEYFPEVKQQYNEVCQKISKQIEDVFSNSILALKNKNFDDLAQTICKITQYMKQFKYHLDNQPINNQLEKVKYQFKMSIDQAVQDVNKILKLQSLNGEDINIINEQILVIEKAEKNLLLDQLINMDYVKIQKNNLFENLFEKFLKISKKIEEILKKQPDQAFLQLKDYMNEMEQFRKIKGIERRTADIYHKTIQELRQQIKRDVLQLLSDFQYDKKKVDFQKIDHCLNLLKCTQYNGAYDQTKEHISQKLLNYSQFEIIQKLREIDLSQRSYGNFSVASELIKELEAFKFFEEYNPILTELRVKACSMFKESVQAVFTQVKEFINATTSQRDVKEDLFIRLDGSKIEDYLNYISAASQNIWTRDDANTLLGQLKEFLAFQKESKNQQIVNHYETIIDLNEQNEKQKTQSALQLASLIKETISLQKYEKISQLIQPKQLIEDLKNRMQQYYIELSHDMSQPTINKQKQAKYINISKLLSHSDNQFGENKFFNLCLSMQNALNDEFKDNYKKILQAIEKKDFVAVKTELMQLNDNPVNQKAMNQIKAQLQYQTETLLEQAKLDALSLGNQIDKDIIMMIIENIELIKKSKSSFKEYLEKNFLEAIDQEIERIISEIDKKISQFLGSITVLLKQSDFFEVEEKREYIFQIQSLLISYSKDNVNKEKLNQLQSDLEKKVEEITAINYDEEKDFVFHPPKQILEKLSKISTRNLKYTVCYTNLQQILVGKVRQLILNYQSSDSSQQSQQVIKVEALINSLPQELKQIFKDQFDTFKLPNEQRMQIFENQFNELKSCEDLERKKVFLEECKMQKILNSFGDRMRKLVYEEFQSILSKFYEDMENGKPLDGVKKAIKLLEYNKHFENDEKIKAKCEEVQQIQGVLIQIFNESTQKHGINYVIEHIRGDEIDKKKLKELYDQFEKEYQEIVFQNLVLVVKNEQQYNQIIEQLVTNAKMKTNKKPHSGQVISIFCLLGIGYIKDNFYNNLVQLGIGEGKSIILAVASIIFALYDIDVYCACQTEYLSQRNYNNFLSLFNTFGVTPNIKYGIFNKICEEIINENQQICDLVVNYISNGFPERSQGNDKDIKRKPKILLIDEVDVFFSQDFYGKLYNPIARLQDQGILNLAQFIWKQRNNHLSLKQVKETECYKQCINKFKNLNGIIDESIKDMISDSKNFEHKYIVQKRQIGYLEQDDISFDINYGYKTLFAYFYEQEQNRVTESKVKQNTFISIKCGSFSYSEIPFKFDCIVGVTGTLDTLSESETKIVQKIYNITKFTYIPSVFGGNYHKFDEKSDMHVENEDNYFKVIRQEIDKNLNRNCSDKNLRSVLVFFDSKQKLNNFYQSPQMADIKMDIKIITEEVSTNIDKKEELIKKATISGQVTLLTASFGYGTDFNCFDQKVLNGGGVHVILTFYSSKKSQEVQIIGRSARQGQTGSYSFVLLDQDLQKIIGPGYEKALNDMRDSDNFYQKLNEYRKKREDQEYDNKNKFIEKIKKDHYEGQKFVSAMLDQNEAFIKVFLANKNKGTNDIPNVIRILCLIDGTASMGPLLNKAKTTVSEIFERSCLIIKNTKINIPEDCFQLQFAVYRDYDQKEGVLQASPWESKANNLCQFLETVEPKGGQDYEEAVEIGLQHANQENQNQEIAAIIILADAPSKSMSSIQSYREKYGGESYWKTTKYSEITDYKKEMQKLKDTNIPIHSFYLDERAKSNFEEISEFTNGKCEGFNIDSNDASDKLIKIIVEPILQNVGKQNGLGDDLYKQYLKLYDKSYK